MARSEHCRADPPGPEHLAATAFIDAGHPTVRAFAERAVADAVTGRERISRLFTAVRDEIRYDPYQLSHNPRDYIASNVISRGVAFCIPKAVVLTAAARSLGIPARLGFSDVKNHLQSPKLAERMGTDVFVFHGYSELYVHGTWRKATPAFNAELCERFSVPPLTFDGSADALLHPSPPTAAPTCSTSATAASTPTSPWDRFSRSSRPRTPGSAPARRQATIPHSPPDKLTSDLARSSTDRSLQPRALHSTDRSPTPDR